MSVTLEDLVKQFPLARLDKVRALVPQLQELPTEALSRLQYLSAQIGCYNGCDFCSQAAGLDIWQFTRRGLTEFMVAVRFAAEELGLRVAMGREAHRPGTIFPYLDNDVMSYRYLDTYLDLADKALGARVRVSSIGYSSKSEHLVAMHQRIVNDHVDVLDGVRISLTPYTYGWKDRANTSREQFTRDLANALKTYRKVFDQLGHGAASGAVELRFAPLLGLGEVTDTHMDGHHVVAAGPHLLISVNPVTEPLPTTKVAGLGERNEPRFTNLPRKYLHLTGDSLEPTAETVRGALRNNLQSTHTRREVDLYLFRNGDGPYYAIEPNMAANGRFTALHIYLQTESRKSGYTDSTRPFLNTLLEVKERHGKTDWSTPFDDATWSAVGEVTAELARKAEELDEFDRAAARHIRVNVLPLVETYINAVRIAEYPASTVFSPNFTLDTGEIVNQGRAMNLFKGLVTIEDEPMTPRQERGYGAESLSSLRGTVWRAAPVPFPINNKVLKASIRGGKNLPGARDSVVIEELDPRHLRNTERDSGTRLRRYRVTGVELEHLSFGEGKRLYGLPGLTERPAT
ncbi:hypothetical protein [Streptomyces sp. NPDC018833]|uniref:hypothetical protein n=1 Tax=Streptomyces sp. NPDC018833 TaxID=3365053 RepID=UPI0037938BD2